MTAIEIESALAEIVLARKNACDQKLQTLDQSAKTERKALMIEQGMYSLCLHAGLLYNVLGERGKVIATKCNRMPKFLKEYPKLLDHFQKSAHEEQLKMTAALYGEVWMDSQFLKNYRTELKVAQTKGSAANVFELQIKTAVVESVLADWRRWRKEQGVYPTALEERL
ncbi:MAG: hypothetical protein IJX28_00705 [Clostridia bacterium]|nr:hypothetical protein [Clostridia bacterium]